MTQAAAVRTIGVAISIPEPWGALLDAHRAASGDPLAPSVPAHVTLLPPTEIPEAQVEEVRAHLRSVAAEHSPFELHLRGSGTFRPVTSVVFVGVARGISECELLESAIRGGPLRRDLHFPYHPHVTVAHDVDEASLDRVYEKLADFDARFRVGGFTLYTHGTDGQWRPEENFPFA
ncbi:2'-5' RNA ligase family protein [Fodinicola feengrottensis]|uniref:2'-5' RNA ligase family protein n=1 Tax=Fodinicola feengrottensis TaxID=435914 RepID=A0ABN2HE74_9ACTN|nr:2'-5' RNA ligase family protein [Fodinicola feengrottensis]